MPPVSEEASPNNEPANNPVENEGAIVDLEVEGETNNDNGAIDNNEIEGANSAEGK